MRRAHITLLVAVFASTAALAGNYESASAPVDGQYIVVLDENRLPPPALTTAEIHRENVQFTAEGLAFEYRGRRGHVYTESLVGFSVSMSRERALAMARDPRVAIVAEDAWIEAAADHVVQFNPPSWGLDRVDQFTARLNGSFEWVQPAYYNEVHAYVLDSGIRSTHEDFGGRVDVAESYSALFDGNAEDCNGHGTHVAGTIGGQLHGVAKNVRLHPVRVLDCQGRGTLSSIIAGIDWITNRMIESPHPAVANISLQTAPSQVLDNAVQASIAAGVVYVVAAGNSGGSACDYSPSRVPEVLTVGAVTASDTMMTTSNHGQCVDLYAPGDSIRSTSNGSDTDTALMSGTSTAAPHVTGTVANLLSQAPFGTPAQIRESVLANAGWFANPASPTGRSPLVYSMIEVAPDSALGTGGLSFTADCMRKNKRCTFTASLADDRFQILRYFWDFGDGDTAEHKRPVIRHGYRNVIGPVEIVLTVATAGGQTFSTSQIIDRFPWQSSRTR